MGVTSWTLEPQATIPVISDFELSEYTLLLVDSADQRPNNSGGKHKTVRLTVFRHGTEPQAMIAGPARHSRHEQWFKRATRDNFNVRVRMEAMIERCMKSTEEGLHVGVFHPGQCPPKEPLEVVVPHILDVVSQWGKGRDTKSIASIAAFSWLMKIVDRIANLHRDDRSRGGSGAILANERDTVVAVALAAQLEKSMRGNHPTTKKRYLPRERKAEPLALTQGNA